MKIDIQTIFEDEHLIAINKQSGLLSIPDRFDASKPNAFDLLKKSHEKLFVVHRIDKETSGILMFAKHAESHKLLNTLFEHSKIKKNYLCIAESTPPNDEGLIDAPIAHSTTQTGKMIIHPKGKESKTYYEVLKRFKAFSVLMASPLTGRTHQIRIHMAHIGCPLVCDPLYGVRASITIADIKPRFNLSDSSELRPLLQRTGLHAWKLEFSLMDKLYHLEAPIPKDLRALMDQLQKWAPAR